MTESYSRRINEMTVISAAAFAGANLFIGLSIGAIWLSMEPLDFMNGFWDQFLRFTYTIMPLFILTLIGLVLSARLDWGERPARQLWLIALGLYALTSAITVFYHLPLNFALRAAEFSAKEAAAARAGWLLWNIPRVILAFGIPIVALRAIVGRSTKGSGPDPTG
ncbi:MAG: DUF1772 domain-containing protein [Pseudomonadota bacterium]